MRLPTFCETGFEFKVLADVVATAPVAAERAER